MAVIRVRMKMGGALLVISILLSYSAYSNADIDCGTVSHSWLLTNSTFHRIRFNLPQTDKLMITYKISFNIPINATARFPIVSIETKRTILLNSVLDPIHKCYLSNLTNIIRLSRYYIYLHPTSNNAGCKYTNGRYICMGSRHLYTGYTADEWGMDIGYRCGEEHIMDMQIDMELQCIFPMQCEKLDIKNCKDHVSYNETAFPNTLGMLSQSESDIPLQHIQLLMEKHYCYQHTRSFLCYSLYPKCQNGMTIIPCMQTCLDALEGCGKVLKIYHQPILCGTFPPSMDPNVCFYEPVTCPDPIAPRHGYVAYTGIHLFNVTKYTCVNGFKLDSDTHRYCTHTGKWNGSEPRCIPVHIYLGIPGIVGLVSGSVVLLIAVVLCIHLRHVLWLMLAHNRFSTSQFYRVASKKQPLFLTYSSEENEKVQNQVLTDMKVELPSWDILTFPDFPAGGSLIDNINKGIYESQAVIVLLSRCYMHSEWCNYEFVQAQTRHAMDPDFRFIIVLFEHPQKDGGLSAFIEELPEGMRLWVQARVYLTYGENLFWNKLRRGLTTNNNP